MWTTRALAAICLLGSVAAVEDFVEVHSGITFIYHHASGIVLTMGQNECYYLDVSSLPSNALQSNFFLLHPRAMLEAAIVVAIGTGNFKNSSLDELRNKFYDLLADTHCLDKPVFQLDSGLLNLIPGGGK